MSASRLIGSRGSADGEPVTLLALISAVQRYLYHRKMAVVAGDVELLWRPYPELRVGADPSRGINAEALFVSSMRGLKPFDGNVSPEQYEQIRARVSGGTAAVLIHGTELYLWVDRAGEFSESGGEIKMVISMRLRDGRWEVCRTDEVLMGEQ